ncbi:homoserine kinase [Leadbetterella byssophila DSM 17132]|uniref:Homoserine kinase n=1 Tax=Leadbetterella byssophila (strain DSM 17132 / JCM 16389 / KACC 11308 / NBRC 106382 / 4M15) TaxID=649349 RepID=E4RYN0_LEAB4|nr:homoserine kinase [Leadbetterella byssophila]ADQ16392.1 homoserine kinase [Leadbetterella byssophila DSM 17132]
MNSIKVFAPATVANVACGFDIFGLAVDNPGDEVILTRRNDSQICIQEITGDGGKLTKDPNKNTVTVPIIKYLESIGSNAGFDVVLHKKMALGSGLGSSSASAVAGVFAANELLGQPLKRKELLPFAMEGERVACGAAHADNVAPALLGGFVVVRSYSPLDVFQVPVPEDLFVSLIHPDVEVNTKDARHILKNEVSMNKAISQMGNVSGMIAGLMSSDYGLIGRSMVDFIIEPIRSILIPRFFEVKMAAMDAGALGCSISGAGPSIFAFSKGRETAEKVATAMKNEFETVNIQATTYVSTINVGGPKIL